MSWARFGSICTNGTPYNPINETCQDETCPGSDVYVYRMKDGFSCDLCRIKHCENFKTKTENEMIDHLIEHQKAGHHVRPSLLIRELAKP